MAEHRASGHIDAYLRDLAASLRGPSVTTSRLIVEIRDHLEDAVAAGVEAGARG